MNIFIYNYYTDSGIDYFISDQCFVSIECIAKDYGKKCLEQAETPNMSDFFDSIDKIYGFVIRDCKMNSSALDSFCGKYGTDFLILDLGFSGLEFLSPADLVELKYLQDEAQEEQAILERQKLITDKYFEYLKLKNQLKDTEYKNLL